MELGDLFFYGVLVAIFVVILFTNKGKTKVKYDERQEMIRNRSYKYGWYTVNLFLLAYVFVNNNFNAKLDTNIILAIVIFGALVVTFYQILKSAYFGIGKKYPAIFGWLMLIVGLMNAVVVIQQFRLSHDLEIGNMACSTMLVVFLVVDGLAIIYRQYHDRRESDK
ncbi:hypothetical protein [uncultured Lactobacillus sp.]|uniref:hypothetical protein n=1 Tax=uncultured Lactobacillus sp. TaxID=153152 RepID=UPI002610FE7C|nr:hypothetical protein [uncultured Lactobacillus sp.]